MRFLEIRSPNEITGAGKPTMVGDMLLISSSLKADLEIIDRIVGRIFVVGECWLVEGCRGKSGHIKIENHGRPIYVHRAIWAWLNGAIPDGVEVCHRCDDGQCVRPSHLFAGSQIDNIADMRAKGRGWSPPISIGLANHKATLSEDECDEIRALVAEGVETHRALAERFSVSKSTIWRIGRRVSRNQGLSQ